MLRMLYLDPKVEKQLKSLRRSGGKAALAAQRSDTIIIRFQSGECSPEDVGRTTKHGEHRIRGCVKYDLGGGYRLLTFERNSDVYILFAGSHDDSHRWLLNNRDISFDIIECRCKPLEIRRPSQTGCCDVMSEDHQINESDDELLHVNQRHLRAIFSGLTR